MSNDPAWPPNHARRQSVACLVDYGIICASLHERLVYFCIADDVGNEAELLAAALQDEEEDSEEDDEVPTVTAI